MWFIRFCHGAQQDRVRSRAFQGTAASPEGKNHPNVDRYATICSRFPRRITTSSKTIRLAGICFCCGNGRKALFPEGARDVREGGGNSERSIEPGSVLVGGRRRPANKNCPNGRHLRRSRKPQDCRQPGSGRDSEISLDDGCVPFHFPL